MAFPVTATTGPVAIMGARSHGHMVLQTAQTSCHTQLAHRGYLATAQKGALDGWNHHGAQGVVARTSAASIPRPVPPAAHSNHHPPNACLGQNEKEAFNFFRENGFLILPDIVPPAVLASACAAVARSGGAIATQPVNLPLLKQTRIWDIVTRLVADPLVSETAQVPFIPQEPSHFPLRSESVV